MARLSLVLVGALVLMIGVVASPSIREDTGEPCRALEKLAFAQALLTIQSPDEPYRLAMRQTIANTLLREGRFDGHTGRAAASRRVQAPPYFGCALGYWQILLNPSTLDSWLAAMWLPG